MGAWVDAWVTLFRPTVTFKPLKLESRNFICGFLIKNIKPVFFFSELSPLLELWSFETF